MRRNQALKDYSVAATAWMDANPEKVDLENFVISYDVDYGR